MPPRPINEQVFYRGQIETFSSVKFGKIGDPTEIRYFQHGPRSSDKFSNLGLEIPYQEFRDGYVIYGFSSNALKLIWIP